MLKLMLTLAISAIEISRTLLTGNLALQDGRISLNGLGDTVIVHRTSQGVPQVHARSLTDAIRAQGFLHAQDRFFQMDLMRRFSAGRLSEIVGPVTVRMDLQQRPLDFQRRADELLPMLPDTHAQLLNAYAQGVNDGLAHLEAPPFEYIALGLTPEPWQPRDSILVAFSMFDMLAFGELFEGPRSIMHQTLHPDVYAFLTPLASHFDATLAEGRSADRHPVPIPGPDAINLRTADASPSLNDPAHPRMPILAAGSNNFAIAGSRTAHGGAILANDMHLMHSVPNTWYRIDIHTPQHTLRGVSLPGAPGIVVGSNTRIAWGFTNVTGDEQDHIIVEPDPDNHRRYRVPEGTEPFGELTVNINVRNDKPVTQTYPTTRWGPVTQVDPLGRSLVLKWSATEPDGFNFRILDLMLATSLDQAIDIAQRWHGPPQNVAIADHAGRVGWTVSGYIPQRIGFDGSVATSWADGNARWIGPLPPEKHPTVIDPPSGYIFTANNRTLPLQQAPILGTHFMPPERANRIAERLSTLTAATELDILHIALDTRSLPHDLYRDTVIEVTQPDDPDPDLARARQLVNSWDGTAGLDQNAFAFLRTLQTTLTDRLLAPLYRPARNADPLFSYNWPLADEPVRRILEERPPHLLPQPYQAWEECLRDVVADAVRISEARAEFNVPWGETNQPAIGHPFSRIIPGLARLLDMPRIGLPGYVTTVRVQAWGFGASERLVVSPGHEDQGILHMPTGQSGHPLSPYYRAGHDDWIHGRPTPLISNDIVSTLLLEP